MARTPEHQAELDMAWDEYGAMTSMAGEIGRMAEADFRAMALASWEAKKDAINAKYAEPKET